MKVENKVIVITGASRGLGRKIALALGKQGANLILIARSSNLLQEVKEEIFSISGKNPEIFIADITDEKSVFKLVDQIKNEYLQVDILINNAGIGIYQKVENISCFEMRKQFEVNFFGTFYCTKALLPLLKNSRAGYILNISSLLSKVPFALTSVYSATKAALNIFSKGLIYELKDFNIKLGTFLPGSIATTFQDIESSFRPPEFLILNPENVVKIILKMITKRKESFIMYKWIMLLMKLKQKVKR